MKKNKLTLWVAVMTIGLLLVQNVQSAFAASYNSLAAYGVDTVAGYSTVLSTSKTYPNQNVVFSVKKPSGGSVQINAKTNTDGVAKADLYDFHTRTAGFYEVSVSMPSQNLVSGESKFIVYPDEISVDQSAVVAQSNVSRADGKDIAYIGVTLKDRYGNALEGHDLNLISSRSADNISKSTVGAVTDVNGSLNFTVNSAEAGVSVFSAVDLTSGTVLTSRAQVAFIGNNADDIGGFFPLAAAASAGPIHHFEISDLPATINPNQNVSFRVTAKDANNLTVENYTGTVHFSAEGANSSNVSLPEDYTFTATESGSHTFSLGLKFTVAGDYKIVVTDIDNQLIQGNKNITAGAGGGGTNTQQQQGQKPSISTPTPGTYSQNVQTISGSAQTGANLKIYDNAQEIGTTQAKQDGTFSFQTAALADGKHSVYVQALDQSNNVTGASDPVEFSIDTTPPNVDEIKLTPSSGIKANDVVTIKVLSEENLSQAAVVFNNDIIELSPGLGIGGTYVGSVKAPAEAGDYPVDVTLVDQLGNEATYQGKATISITANGGTAIINGTQETQQPQTQETQETQQANQPPSQVFGVIAYGADKKVTLVWEAATDDVMVKNYRIYYGTDPENLDKNVDTWDASTTWYVPGLDNGKEYYFEVAAVDDSGQESEQRSETVSAIPFTLEVSTNVTERPTGPIGGTTTEDESLLKGAALEGYMPPETVKNGPELIWILLGSGLLGGISKKLGKKKNK